MPTQVPLPFVVENKVPLNVTPVLATKDAAPAAFTVPVTVKTPAKLSVHDPVIAPLVLTTRLEQVPVLLVPE